MGHALIPAEIRWGRPPGGGPLGHGTPSPRSCCGFRRWASRKGPPGGRRAQGAPPWASAPLVRGTCNITRLARKYLPSGQKRNERILQVQESTAMVFLPTVAAAQLGFFWGKSLFSPPLRPGPVRRKAERHPTRFDSQPYKGAPCLAYTYAQIPAVLRAGRQT
jgi:hypothetical protein